MPKATIGDLCRELIRRGLNPEHPAAAVFNATRADETVLSASLATLPECIAAAPSRGPCIIFIGVAAARRATTLLASATARAGADAGSSHSNNRPDGVSRLVE